MECVLIPVCCRVLPCIAACCSVLQCVAVCWSVFRHPSHVSHLFSGTLYDVRLLFREYGGHDLYGDGSPHLFAGALRVAGCCSVLQCVVICCNVLQCRAVRYAFVLRCVAVTMHTAIGHCVAVCCSVLQCVAVCCSMLQCVAVCRSVFQCVAVCCCVLQCVAVCCSVLQGVAGCCSVLQRVAVCCDVLLCVAGYCNVLQCVAVCCSQYLCCNMLQSLNVLQVYDAAIACCTVLHAFLCVYIYVNMYLALKHVRVLQCVAVTVRGASLWFCGCVLHCLAAVAVCLHSLHCNTQQHIATHCKHTETHCNTLQHTAAMFAFIFFNVCTHCIIFWRCFWMYI